MARRSTGGVVVDTRRKSPVFALRFRAYGRRQFVTLGSVDEGWSRAKAEDRLRHVLADVERQIWRPPDREPAPAPVLPSDPLFHEFASRWYADNEPGCEENTRLDYSWQLSSHLLPFFAGHRLSQITAAEVDRYKAAKLRQATLGPTSINKTITRLAQICEVACEYGLLDKNSAKGRHRKVKASKPAPVWLDRAEHLRALLDAAGELDQQARRGGRHIPRQALLSTLLFAGLRIGELLDLRWRDVDLTGERIIVREAKTEAGAGRIIDLLPVLRLELITLKSRSRRAGPNELVFGTSTGNRQQASNVRRRVLAPAVRLANQRLEEAGEVPLPALTPHKLRHSYASLLVALGVDPSSVMAQIGHSSPSFTLRVYAHGMRRDQASKQALRELVGGVDWAAPGSNVVPVNFSAVAGAR